MDSEDKVNAVFLHISISAQVSRPEHTHCLQAAQNAICQLNAVEEDQVERQRLISREKYQFLYDY